MIVSKNMHDDLAVRLLKEFVGRANHKDRRHLALAALSRLAGVQQILSNKERLEISPTVRAELETLITEILTCVDVVLSNRR